jgi:hypothetical protein
MRFRSYLHISGADLLINHLILKVYSLIAQKDNAISMSDNATLKKLSEESKRIALAATRDSAAMRTMTEFTILFLPGTSVAVSIAN